MLFAHYEQKEVTINVKNITSGSKSSVVFMELSLKNENNLDGYSIF